MASGQWDCKVEAKTPVTSLLATHIWKYKGTSDTFVSSMWLSSGNQESAKHNDKQSQDTQAHCDGSCFAVFIRKTFFFWKTKEIRECVIADHHTPRLYIYIPEKLANTSQKKVSKTFLFFFFLFFLSYTYYIFICSEPYLKKKILAPFEIATCFTGECSFTSTVIVLPSRSVHTQ